MENTLRVIVDTDKASRLDVEKAKERRENLTAELSERKKEIDEKHRENAENAIARTRANTEMSVKRAALELEEKTKQKADIIQKKYDSGHSAWTAEIVRKVIG